MSLCDENSKTESNIEKLNSSSITHDGSIVYGHHLFERSNSATGQTPYQEWVTAGNDSNHLDIIISKSELGGGQELRFPIISGTGNLSNK